MIFEHTLSYPEHLWLSFFREFFSQPALIVDPDGRDLANNFRYERAVDPGNRKFDIVMEYDLDKANPNILPSLVIEDLGVARLNIGLNHMSHWQVSPETYKRRTDLLRSSYVFHCCSRNRGESRLMASIVSNAISVFYDQLKRSGFHKIEPWAIGKTMPLRLDSDEVYVDTPVQVTFEFHQTWQTVEGGDGAERYCLHLAAESLTRFVRTVMDVGWPAINDYVMTSMAVDYENVTEFVLSRLEISDAMSASSYINASADVYDPLSAASFIRSSMRVA